MINRKFTRRDLFELCKSCLTGSCCQDGVEVDLKEAKKIASLKLNLKKPWFEHLFKDRDFPSGWGVSTVVRNGRCVFQRKDYKCRIYEYRPKFCRDFPLEKGRMAEFYDYLCEKPSRIKFKAKRDIGCLPKSRF